MRKLSLAALFAIGVSLMPNGASAALLSAPAALASKAPDGIEQVHWRRYRHCHPRRGYCHGGRAYRRYWAATDLYIPPPPLAARSVPRWRYRYWW
jgi:hypothetical protein